MNICFLYGNPKALAVAQWLREKGHTVYECSKPITSIQDVSRDTELLISFSYRHYISQKVISEVNGNAINIHISYLPWNRGADPNIWSWIDDTPKGVTIHYISEKIDAGDIIAQKTTDMSENETLASSYEKLMADAICLFKEIFSVFRYWNDMRKQPTVQGSFHNLRDFDRFRSGIDYSMTPNILCKMIKEAAGHNEGCIPC